MSDNKKHIPDELTSQKPNLSSVVAIGSGISSISGLSGLEQQPTMRSIAPSSISRTIHVEPALKRESPGRIQKYSELKRVAMDKSTDFPLKKNQLNQFNPNDGKTNLSIRRPKSAAPRWNIDHSSLRNRPDYLPPPRSFRIVRGVNANIVAQRLTKCLQSRSIKSKFSKSESNIAHCLNIDFVNFHIRLYSMEGEESSVQVEIHRMYGDAMSFMQDCRALLDASMGNGTTENVTPTEEPLYLRLPVSEMAFVKNVTFSPFLLAMMENEEPVKITAELLASNQSDSNMLGMESLASLTNIKKTCKSTALSAAKRVLCPNCEGNQSFNIHNFVMSLIIYVGESENCSFYEGTAIRNHTLKLRNLAICSVSNSLELMVSEGSLLETIYPSQMWYNDVLIPRLVQDLNAAGENPHDACYASRCVSYFASHCDLFAEKIKIVGGLSALKNAVEVGDTEFAFLAREARSCHSVLFGTQVF